LLLITRPFIGAGLAPVKALLFVRVEKGRKGPFQPVSHPI